MRAFDELRFGPQRTLNLREGLPTAAEATRRCEVWLREQQIRGTGEVLVITGRGSHSPGGIAVIRGAIEKLLFSLHRRGVVSAHREHNPGAFAVELAPVRALMEAPARLRESPKSVPGTVSLHGLSTETTDLLRQVAERSLAALGVQPDDARIGDEMHRFLGRIVPGLPADNRMEEHLQRALRAALADYD